MKKILIAACCLSMLTACGMKEKKADWNFKIDGNLTGLTDGIEQGDTVRMFDVYDSEEVLAEAVVGEDMTFTLTGNAKQPMLAMLTVNDQDLTFVALEDSDLKVTYDAERDDMVVTGSYTNENRNKYDDEIFSIYGELRTAEEEQVEEIIGRMKAVMHDAIIENRDNLLSVVMLENYYSQFAEPQEILAVVDALAAPLKELKGVERMVVLSNNAKNAEIGAKLSDIKLTDTKGAEIAVSELLAEGKWVLVDFWATWCGPCRGEIPHLVEAYRKFAPKGLEIYGITLDRPGSEQKWRDFVEQNDMTWINVWGYAGDECKAAELYNVRSIPSNFLFSPEGILVDKDLRGDEIEAILSKHIDGK